MALISEKYKKLNFDLHAKEGAFGSGAFRNAQEIANLIAPTGASSVLDYGCGKGTLKPALKKIMPGLTIREYDPAVVGKRDLPKAADVVTCTDVMEHIEPECLEDVIAHLRSLTGILLIASITTIAAEKFLSDGRNAHLIVEPKEWWVGRFSKHFRSIETFDAPGGFVGLFRP